MQTFACCAELTMVAGTDHDPHIVEWWFVDELPRPMTSVGHRADLADMCVQDFLDVVDLISCQEKYELSRLS